MMKKVVGMLIVGLLIATILPVGSSTAQKTEEKQTKMLASQMEVRIKGGFGVQAIIKNTGTTDLIGVTLKLVLDGQMIFPGWEINDAIIDVKAGRTKWVIFAVRGFGPTNIELTVDTITETGSGFVLGSFVIGVK
jgi:hypothetical protein